VARYCIITSAVSSVLRIYNSPTCLRTENFKCPGRAQDTCGIPLHCAYCDEASLTQKTLGHYTTCVFFLIGPYIFGETVVIPVIIKWYTRILGSNIYSRNRALSAAKYFSNFHQTFFTTLIKSISIHCISITVVCSILNWSVCIPFDVYKWIRDLPLHWSIFFFYACIKVFSKCIIIDEMDNKRFVYHF